MSYEPLFDSVPVFKSTTDLDKITTQTNVRANYYYLNDINKRTEIPTTCITYLGKKTITNEAPFYEFEITRKGGTKETIGFDINEIDAEPRTLEIIAIGPSGACNLMGGKRKSKKSRKSRKSKKSKKSKKSRRKYT